MDMTISPAIQEVALDLPLDPALPRFLQRETALDEAPTDEAAQHNPALPAEVANAQPSFLAMTAGAAPSSHSATKPACTFPAGLSFEGSATFPCDFAVEGEIKGRVELSGQSKLVIAKGGRIEGEISSKHIRIEGHAHGVIDASGGVVSFGESARASGTINYARMSMAEGAEVEATMKKIA